MTATWTSPRTWATGEIVTAAQLNTHIRDMFDWALDRGLTPTSDLDGTVGNTTSGSFTDMGNSHAFTTVKANAAVLLVCDCSVTIGSNADVYAVTLDLDGSNQGDATRGVHQLNGATNSQCGVLLILVVTVATAGAHTLKLQAKRVSGSSAAITITGMHLWAWELA